MLVFFHVKTKQLCVDQTQKRCVSETVRRGKPTYAGVLSQSASRNHALLITKSALVIKKNALCLSQPAFSKFALHVIKREIVVLQTRTRCVISGLINCIKFCFLSLRLCDAD